MHASRVRLLCTAGAFVCAIGALTGNASAQQRVRPGEVMTAQPVVQPLPGGDGLALNAALSRLGRNPRDLDALIDAGNAALKLGDVEAASGFFRRANQVSPTDSRVKAGLGGALVRNGDPLAAIALFDEAEKAGAQLSLLAGDRGLAYDLVGDNATAQRLYRMALARAPSEEVTQRLALSQAISGDKRGVEQTLLPLLRDQSKAAWRTRTFALAILGQTDEAISTAKTILPHDLAEQMTPYLRYMPQLTRAQQASAANLGNFPRAAEIGRDDPRFAQYAAASARPTAVAALDAGLVPKGEPLGRSSRSRSDRSSVPSSSEARRRSRIAARSASVEAARVAPPAIQPSRQAAVEPRVPAAVATNAVRPSMSAPVATSAVPRVPQIAVIASAPTPGAPSIVTPSSARPETALAPRSPAAATPTPAPVVAAPVVANAALMPAPAAAVPPRPAVAAAQPGFDLARLPQGQAPLATPAPAPASAPAAAAPAPTLVAPPTRISLAEAFSDIGRPSTHAAPAEGAVDISRFAPARPKPAPEKAAPAKPAPPSHPSRIWVQLGIGRDKSALSTDWKRISGKAAALFKGRKGYVSDMGQTNRMITGPFDSSAQANKFVADLKGSGVTGAYIWTSPAGQVVDALPNR